MNSRAQPYKIGRILSEWWSLLVAAGGMTIIFYVRTLRLHFLVRVAVILILAGIVVLHMVRRAKASPEESVVERGEKPNPELEGLDGDDG